MSAAAQTCHSEPAEESPPLPAGWRWTTVGEITESMKNGVYKQRDAYIDDGFACLRMYNIDDGKIVWRDIKRMRLTKEETREYQLLPGDILVNRVNSRELVGKAAVIPDGLEACVYESKNIRLRIRQGVADPHFVNYRLLQAGHAHFDRNAQQVVGMASISQPQIAAFRLPLPPLSEQRRIVAEIEKQFTRLEAGLTALRRVAANLKRYRASILKAACEGKLVPTEAELAKTRSSKSEAESARPAKQIRNKFERAEVLLQRILKERREKWAGKGKYKEPAAPDTANLPKLPEGWCWAGFTQLDDGTRHAMKAGPFGSSLKKSVYVPKGYKIYGQEQVIRGDPYYGDYYIDKALFEKLRSCEVKPGDLLISLVGTTGRILILPDDIEPGIINPRLVKLSLNKGAVDVKYVRTYLQSASAKAFFKLAAHGGTMEILNLGILKEIPVPLPPLAEQQRIVAEVERRLSVVDELEAVVESNLKRAARLRQSILQRAFTGKLKS